MAPPTTKLYDLCVDMLAAINVGWPGDATPLPALQYVADGAIAWDGCEVLATSLVRTFATVEGDPTLEGYTVGTLMGARAAVMDIFLLRCVPVITESGTTFVVPKPDEVQAAAEIILLDAQALTNTVVAIARDGLIGGCRGLSIESWTAAGPEGGMGGGVLRVRMVTL